MATEAAIDFRARVAARFKAMAHIGRRDEALDSLLDGAATAGAPAGAAAATPTWAERRALRRTAEFLPAALEIVETPPSPIGRAIAWCIIAFFVVALTWASLGHVDIIATAPGKIVPTGRTKVIQPMEIGVVRAVRVQEGEAVKAGQVLVELNPTTSGADRDRLASELMASRLDAARLKAALVGGDDPLAAFAPPADVPPDQIALQRQLLGQLVSENRAKIAGLERQTAQREADRAGVLTNINRLEQALPLLRERADVRHKLADQGYGSRMTYLEVQQDLVTQEHELLAQRNKLDESTAALASVEEELRRTVAEYRRNLLGDLTQAEQKAASLEQELIKAQERYDLQTLTAPVDGVVQQIQVHTLGGVVTPAQTLMAIVPADSQYEIEAMVQNKDIGFVRVGQDAEIKVDTFNFTRYGLLRGTVLSVSQDAVPQNRPAQQTGAAGAATQANGIAPDGTPTTSQELAYVARVSLDRASMEIDGKDVNLGAGMAVTVEIKTGARRLLEYVLSPVLRYRQESLRER